MTLTPETRIAADKFSEYFLVPFHLEDGTRAIRDLLPRFPQPFANVAETFLNRISATVQTTATPFLLANAAAHDKHYQRISIAERIRARSIELEPDEDDQTLEVKRDTTAREIANSKMEEFSKSVEGINSLVLEMSKFLLDLHRSPDIQSVAHELLLQGTVSTWSALEMLVCDELILLLDNHPELVEKILSDPIAKKKFELPKLNIEDLALRGFDLSNQMGRLLFNERDLSNFKTLKCACEALIDDSELREKLSLPSIWRLNQNRHLIVHRRGIVDEEYLRNTGSHLSLGEQLYISPKEFEDQVLHVLGIGNAFLNGLLVLAVSDA